MPGTFLTMVADRKSDIYSLLARLPAGCEAVLRASRTRRIAQADQDLFTFLRARPVMGEETVWLRGDLRRHQQGRYATLVYRSSTRC